MEENILNIYLEIQEGKITGYRAISYRLDGSDEEKVTFLRSKANEDYRIAYRFDAPADKDGKFMSWKSFEKLRKRNMEIRLFEEIFSEFNLPAKPLILVTPVVDGKIESR